MQTYNQNSNRTNWSMFIFTIVIGLILLTNLFDYVTWEIWYVGLYIVGGIFFINLLYKILQRKNWAYKTTQSLIFFLILALLSHTVFAITNPDYLKTKYENLSNYEIYTETLELKANYYQRPVKHKTFKAKIMEREYSIIDSTEKSYYFKAHPPRSNSEDMTVRQSLVNSNLKIELNSINYKQTPLQELLNQHPILVLGVPQIPLSIDVNTKNTGTLNIDLNKHSIEEIRVLLQGGEVNIKLSSFSSPKSKYLIINRGGKATISLPRESDHTIKYDVKEKASLIIEGNNIKGSGKYEIFSKNENEIHPIEIQADQGEVIINTY